VVLKLLPIPPKSPPPYNGSGDEPWRLTGYVHFRQGIFNRAVVYVEERRHVFRPKYTGHTPANWQEQTRWRRARISDLSEIQSTFGAS
jgi:hypothetical protein